MDIAFWLVSRTVLPLRLCISKLPPIDPTDNVLDALPLRVGRLLDEGRDEPSYEGKGNAFLFEFGEAGEAILSMENRGEGDDMA